MRNLSMEAAKMAEEQMMAFHPELRDPEYRKKLSPEQKQQVFMDLCMFGEQFEAVLINLI